MIGDWRLWLVVLVVFLVLAVFLRIVWWVLDLIGRAMEELQ